MIPFPNSWLFTPGSRPDRFAKAMATDADAIILDLEDAVAEGDKSGSRGDVVDFVAGLKGWAPKQICVRINPLRRRHGLEDLSALSGMSHGPDYILIPKSEDPSELALADHVLADQGSKIRIIALVESARGVSQAPALAGATPRLAALMFGAADYAADLGRQVSSFRPDFARQSIVNAAASGGISAIDSPFFSIEQRDELHEECASSRAMGFAGKAAIHPSQIASINGVFAPTSQERELAERIIGAAPEGVGMLDGKMIDIAMVRWARLVSAG